MFNPTFKRPQGNYHPGRSPSPPRRYVEPLSPPFRPAPIEPHFNYPAINSNIDFDVRPDSTLTATPRVRHYKAGQKKGHQRTSSTIDTLAEVALSTSPAYQIQNSYATPRSNGIGHGHLRASAHGSEPPHKRARSEVLPFPVVSQYASRPATSYESAQVRPGDLAALAHRQDTYESRVEEAALLLNFRTGGWPTLNQFSPRNQSTDPVSSTTRPHANSFPQEVLHYSQAEIAPHASLLPAFDPQRQPRSALPSAQRLMQNVKSSPVVSDQDLARPIHPPPAAKNEIFDYMPGVANSRKDAIVHDRAPQMQTVPDEETSRATSVDVTVSEGSEVATAKKRRGWPKGKPRGVGARRTVAEKGATKKAAARRKTMDLKKSAKRRSDAVPFNRVDDAQSTLKRRKSTNDIPDIVTNEFATMARAHSVPAQVPMIVRPASSPKVPRRSNKVTPEVTCSGCAINRDLANSNGELKDEWISCNGCKLWFHVDCAGFKKAYEVRDVDKFFCPACEPKHGKTTWVRKSTRAHVSVDYAELQRGVLKTSEESMEHHYIQPIKDGDFEFDPEFFPRMPPELVTKQFFERGGFTEPICIPATLNPRPWLRKTHTGAEKGAEEVAHAEGPSFMDDDVPSMSASDFEYDAIMNVGQDKLDMVMPQNLTVRQVSELVGPDTPLEVIDVKTQGSGGKKWNLARWADYYEEEGDKQIRNVISLEVSQTKLGRLLRRPKVVRDIDLQDQVWPAKETEQGKWPKVQFYCLMSVADSYTDFHIDFGGSSVYYHILKGKKTFFFIPPKPKHLKAYEDWNDNPQQNFTFLPNITNECYRVDLGPGDTMLIPSGWIHAVWTPETSLVIGGNFLTRMSYQNQFRVAQIEKNNHTPRKFRYPYFQRLMWYTVIDYLEKDPLPQEVSQLFHDGKRFERDGIPIWVDYDGDLATQDSRAGARNQRYYSRAELDGLPDLVNFIFRTVMIVMGRLEGISADQQKQVNSGIPKGHGEPLEIAKTFALWVAWKRGDEDPPAWAHPDAVLPNKEEGSTMKKLSARALKDMERKEAIAAWRIAPDRQSARVRAAAEAAASSGPLSIKTPEPTETSARSREPEYIDHRHHSFNPVATSPSHQPSASMIQPMQFAMDGMHGPYLSTPKTSVLGPKRVACDACRKRRIRCKHKDLVVQAGDPFQVSQPWESNPAIDATFASSVYAPEMLSDDIQVSPMRSGNCANGFYAGNAHEQGSPNGTSPNGQHPGPLPGTNAYLSQHIPMAINGVPIFGEGPKRGRSKACAECRKSKRRCVHDENGHVDPIKAAETPVPRGSVAAKKRPSAGEVDATQVQKKTRPSTDQINHIGFDRIDSSDDQTAQALTAALGRDPYTYTEDVQQEHVSAPAHAHQAAQHDLDHEQQHQPLIDPSLSSMYDEPSNQAPFGTHGYPYPTDRSQPFAFNSLEAIASEVLDMNGGHPDEGYSAQEPETSRTDNQAFDAFVSADAHATRPAKTDGSIDSAVSLNTAESNHSGSEFSPKDVAKEEAHVAGIQPSVETSLTSFVPSSPDLSRQRPTSSRSNVESLPLYRPPPPPSTSPELSKRRPLIPNGVSQKVNGDASSSSKRKRESFGESVASKKLGNERHPFHSGNGTATASNSSVAPEDYESLELAKSLQQDDLGLRKRSK